MISFKKIFILCLIFFSFKIKSISISYAILTHNETESLDYLLKFLKKNKDNEDEVIIVDDFSDNSETLQLLHNASSISNTKIYKRALNFDFSSQRNYADSLCSGDYIFSIDADQVPSLYLMQNLKRVINSRADAYRIPILIMINGLSDFDARVNTRNWINWPNYKIVIYKNSKKGNWIRPVHEGLRENNFSSIEKLPPHEKFSIIEIKTVSKTNNSYNFYFNCYKNWLIKSLQNNNRRDFELAARDLKSTSYKNLILKIIEDKRFINCLERNKLYHFLFDLLDVNIQNKQQLLEYIKQSYLLIEKNKIDINKLVKEFENNINASTDKSGNTLLVHAIYNNDLGLVRKLLKNGADPLIANINGHIPIHHAMHLRNEKIVRRLLRPTLKSKLKKYNLSYFKNINNPTDDMSHTLLMHAAYRNYFDLTKLLLKAGADPLITDKQNKLALNHAKYSNNQQVYDLLLTKTIEVLFKNENLEFKGVVNLPINQKNQTPVIYSVINNKYFLTELLIEYGAALDIKDDFGKTALDYAIYFYKTLNNEKYKSIYDLLIR